MWRNRNIITKYKQTEREKSRLHMLRLITGYSTSLRTDNISKTTQSDDCKIKAPSFPEKNPAYGRHQFIYFFGGAGPKKMGGGVVQNCSFLCIIFSK